MYNITTTGSRWLQVAYQVESVLGQFASLLAEVHDFVVEYGEVKCQSQTNWVGRSKVGGCLLCLGVRITSSLSSSGSLIFLRHLSLTRCK